MRFKAVRLTVLFLALVHLVIALVVTLYVADPSRITASARTAWRQTTFLPPHLSPGFGALGQDLAAHATAGLLAGALVWLALPFLFSYYRRRAAKQEQPEYVRGAKFAAVDEVAPPRSVVGVVRDTFAGRERESLRIGEAFVPVEAETQHALVIGRPGVGKTVLISELLAGVRRRGDRAIVYDFKGDYLPRFFDPKKDVIFNPVDTRCLPFSPLDEVESTTDVDAISASLVPPAHGPDSFFHDAARDVLTGLLHHCFRLGQRDNSDVWRAITLPGPEISDILRDTPGGERGWRYVEDGSGKQALSVFATLMQYAGIFELMSSIKRGFTIRDWVEKGTGWIFVCNYSEVADTLRPALSLFLDLAGRKLLGLPDDRDRRVFVVVDEFGTLQKLSTILRLLTLGRSKGASVWLGIQDIGQIRSIYGRDHAGSILNACGTSAVFSVADPETAEYLSKRVGETEYWETQESLSMGPADHRDGLSLSRRKTREPLILPAELAGLPALDLFLQPSWSSQITRTRLTPRDYPESAPALVLRPDLRLTAAPAPPAPAVAPLAPGAAGLVVEG